MPVLSGLHPGGLCWAHLSSQGFPGALTARRGAGWPRPQEAPGPSARHWDARHWDARHWDGAGHSGSVAAGTRLSGNR